MNYQFINGDAGARGYRGRSSYYICDTLFECVDARENDNDPLPEISIARPRDSKAVSFRGGVRKKLACTKYTHLLLSRSKIRVSFYLKRKLTSNRDAIEIETGRQTYRQDLQTRRTVRIYRRN